MCREAKANDPLPKARVVAPPSEVQCNSERGGDSPLSLWERVGVRVSVYTFKINLPRVLKVRLRS